MTKLVTYSIVACAGVWLVAGCAGGATARQADEGCCGPVRTTTNFRTVQPQRFVTRYHDVSVWRRVNNVRRIVDVTRIRPIVRIHEITRVFHHTIVRPVHTYEYATQPIPLVQPQLVAQPVSLAQPLPSVDYVYPGFGYQPGCGCTW